jgi:two-component system LytT family response regulator
LANSLRILIVDDEELARQKIRRFLRETDLEYQIEEAKNGREALDTIAVFKPEIVFLDIQMPGLSGFDVLYHLENRNFHLIFQTAYDEFAVKAFEENACDYLLKPFSRERFQHALDRALTRRISDPVQGFQNSKQYLKTLVAKDRGNRVLVDAGTVESLVSQDHYCIIYADGEEYLSDLSLSRLASGLDPACFIRVHRNAVLNLMHLARLADAEQGFAETKSGRKIEVSRRLRPALIRALQARGAKV